MFATRRSSPFVHAAASISCLIALIVAAILLSATWDPGINLDIYGTKLALQNLVRDAALVLIAMLLVVADGR